MPTRLLCAAVVILAIAVRLDAQTSPPRMFLPSSEPNLKKLFADREAFVKEYYQPDDATLVKIRQAMNEVLPFQEKYQKDTALTLSRISLAMGIVSEPGTSAEERTARMNRFSEQAGRIYYRAPLSLANVAKMSETLVGAEKVTIARAKISGQLSSRLQGQALDITKLDMFFSPPPSATPRPVIARSSVDSQLLSNRQPTPAIPLTDPSKPPSPPPTKQAPPSTPTAQATPPAVVTPPQPAPPPPPPPPKVVKIAPPKDTWSKDADAIRKKYNYNADQQKVADSVVTSVMDRAAKAGGEKDVSGNMPIDVLYDELIQRLDSLATIEQKLKANPASTAAPTTQPAGH